MCGFIAQMVEHRTGIRGGHGFESRWSLDFFRLLLSNCLNWKIYCEDHSSLSFNLYTAFFCLQRGKQHWQGRDRSDNNFHDVNLNARNSSKQHSERRFSNPQRREEFRSLEDRQFDSKRTSSYTRKGNNKFTSNRGFHFNNESRRKKWNPRNLKRYTF